MLGSWLLGLIFACPSGFASTPAVGPSGESYVLVVREELTVFAEPSPTSEVIALLRPEDEVTTDAHPRRGYRRVVIPNAGQFTVGYVAEEDIMKSEFRLKTFSNRPLSAHSNHRISRWEFGGGVAWSQLRQSEATYTLQDSTSMMVSTLESQTLNPMLVWGRASLENWSWRFAAVFRHSHFVGLARQSQPLGPAPSKIQVERDSTSVGGSLALRRHFESLKWIWLGPYIEAGLGLSTKLSLDGIAAATSERDLIHWLVLGGGAGLDWDLGGSLKVSMDLRLGTNLTTKPTILAIEPALIILYRAP